MRTSRYQPAKYVPGLGGDCIVFFQGTGKYVLGSIGAGLKLNAMEQRYWHLKNCSFLENLNDSQLAQLERRCLMRRYPAGNPVYLPSESADSIMLVATGLVKICNLTFDGRASTLVFVRPGEIFGESSLFDEPHRDEYVEAVEPTTIVRIPREEIQRLMNERLDIALQVTKLVGFRQKKIERRLRSLLYVSNQKRLTHLLLDLADDFGVKVEEGVRLGLRLSHQEIANLIGSTRETVSGLMSKMKSDGLIKGRRHTVILSDVQRLAASVERDLP